MKKLTIGLSLLLGGHIAESFASLYPNRFNVCVPSYCGHFTFGLAGLYWRAQLPQSDFALSYPVLTSAGDPLYLNGVAHNNDRDYDWGFQASVGYILPCSGNNLNLTYTHWNDTSHRIEDRGVLFSSTAGFLDAGVFPVTFTLGVPGPFEGLIFAFGDTGAIAGALPVGTAFSIAFTPADLRSVTSSVKYQNHTWDLDFGQAINIGSNFRLRWFGGLRYTHLDYRTDVTHTYSTSEEGIVGATIADLSVLVNPTLGAPATTDTATVVPVFDVVAGLSDIVRQKSDFDGIGPRFGLDADYYLGWGFSLAGSLSTSLLVGEQKSNYSERLESNGTVTLVGGPDGTAVELDTFFFFTVVLDTAVIPGFETGPAQEIIFKYPDQTRIIPNIDGKLALDWTYRFNNCSRTQLGLEAGYMVSYYFNGIDRLFGVDGTAPETLSRFTQDISFNGPYIGIKVAL